MNVDELDKVVAVLKKVSESFPQESEESKAIAHAVDAILYVSNVKAKEEFVKFLADRGRPLTEWQILYLRSVGVEVDDNGLIKRDAR